MADIKITVDYKDVDKAQKSVEKLQQSADKINELNSSYGNWTRTVTKNGEEQYKTYKKIENGIQTVTKVQGDNVRQTISAAKATKTFGDEVKNAFKSFTTFASIAMIWQQAIRLTKDMVNQVKELDSSLVELQKVTDLEGDSLENFTDKAFKLGQEVGRAGKEVIDATAIFARSGYTVQESLDLSKTALIMTNVGDGIGSVEEAATSLISVLKAYNLEVSESMRVTDLLNQVSNTSAINFEDLTEGITRTGAVFAKADTSIEELSGLLTRCKRSNAKYRKNI